MEHGKIHPPETLILRVGVGEATDENQVTYELSTDINDGSPIVRSVKTEQWFILPWADIINLSIDAGINEFG